jgi:hypothetical protein
MREIQKRQGNSCLQNKAKIPTYVLDLSNLAFFLTVYSSVVDVCTVYCNIKKLNFIKWRVQLLHII